jgi:hypothetical protein
LLTISCGEYEVPWCGCANKPNIVDGCCLLCPCFQALDERDKLHAQLQQVGSLQQQLAAASAAAAAATSAASGWEEKFMRERAVRRKLHEQLQVRPPQQQQRSCCAAAAAFMLRIKQPSVHRSTAVRACTGMLDHHDTVTFGSSRERAVRRKLHEQLQVR